MNRNLILLWIADSTSIFGTAIYSLTLTLLALNYSESIFAAGSVLFVATIPYLFLGIIGGVVADRLNRKKIMLICDIGRALLVLSIPIIYGITGELSIIYIMVIAFLVTCFRAFFFPANQASIPILVDNKDELTKVNSYISSTNNLSIVLGPSLGGIALIFTDNIPILLYVTAATFTISAVCVYFINFPQKQAEQGDKSNILKDAYTGIKFIFRGDILILIMILAFTVQLIIGDGITQLVFPSLLEDLELNKEQFFGYTLSIIALSASITSIVIANIKIKKTSLWVFSGYFMRGFCYLLLILSLVYGWIFMVISAIALGISYAISGPTLTTILQQRSPNDSLGKVMAVRSTIGNITDSISYLFIGGLVSLSGLTLTLSISAGLAIVSTVIFFVWWRYVSIRSQFNVGSKSGI